MRKALLLGGAVGLAFFYAAGSGRAGVSAEDGPRLGRPVRPDVVRGMDLGVAADGTGLPGGSGSVAEGRAVYDAKCAACHGAAGGGGLADRLTGGAGTLSTAKPIMTVSSYWPYAPPLFDYIRRTMPLTAPQSLEDREVYGLVAYLLSLGGVVGVDTRLDARSLARIRMPNRDGFVSLADQGFDGNIERIEPAKGPGQ
jgi:cytochrome c